MSIPVAYDTIIIGGGFFGSYLATYLSKKNHKVLVVEKEANLMARASYVNQARVHNGYHYPRSILTAFRSRESYPVFTEEFSDCIDDEFTKYYLIGKLLGKVSSQQFAKFCNRIGAPYTRDRGFFDDYCNPALVEDAFEVTECAFDAAKIAKAMQGRLYEANVEVAYNSRALGVKEESSGHITVEVFSEEKGKQEFSAKQVFNCTYAMLNNVPSKSGFDILPLKHEVTEICMVDVPEPLKDKGITVMCGPFFSLMPFPDKKMHSFTHVRYTPHFQWHDREEKLIDSHKLLEQYLQENESFFRKMCLDAQRYMPILKDLNYDSSLWEVKTLLPSSEHNDSRPILFKKNAGMKGFHSILGGKIDNVYDMINIIERERMY